MKPFSPHEDQRFGLLFDRYKVIKKILNKKKIIVFDVGANDGNTIKEICSNFKTGIIHSFEPILEKKIKLETLKKKFTNFKIYLNFFALGEKSSKKKIFNYNFKRSAISSFFNINQKSFLFIKNNKKKYYNYINKIRVDCKTIDSYFISKKLKKINLLKIDTQGYETKILRGAKKTLSKIDIIVFSQIYFDFYLKPKNTFSSFEKYLIKDFYFWDICHLYKNPKYYNTDHIDFIYINKKIYKKLLKPKKKITYARI